MTGTITKLHAENIKRLRAVDITPEGAVVTIRGQNAQGKTSVLDSIAYALGGKGIQPQKPIRKGEAQAVVVLELDDIVVERRWSSDDKSTLEVRSKEGAKFPSPQAMLDKLVGDLSFDPLAFLRLDPKKQAETLGKLTGLDYAAHQTARQAVFDQRTQVNRENSRLNAQLAGYGAVDLSAEPVDPAALVAEQKRLTVIARDGEQKQRLADRAATELLAKKSNLQYLETQLAEARKNIDAAEQALMAAKAEADSVPDVLLDIGQVEVKLADIEKTNKKARDAAEVRRLTAEHDAGTAKAAILSEKLSKLSSDWVTQVESAKMPITGLTVIDGALALNGLPIDQASSAEQLTVSVAMGLALNPKLRVLLVRDGSLLDKVSMTALAKMAADAQAQVWIEVVGDEGVGIVIEDGMVRDDLV